jgi:hypothetical protein
VSAPKDPTRLAQPTLPAVFQEIEVKNKGFYNGICSETTFTVTIFGSNCRARHDRIGAVSLKVRHPFPCLSTVGIYHLPQYTLRLET